MKSKALSFARFCKASSAAVDDHVLQYSAVSHTSTITDC